MEMESTEPGAPAAPVVSTLRFNGSGGEYFRIWIVNLLLTIVTVGIYSAWAKVRRLKYFYRNTELAGTGFEYHGQPKAILIGRIVALTLFAAYQYSVEVSVTLFAVVVVVLLVVWPWLIHNSLRFRLYNSSYRGLRFHFVGSLAETYAASYKWPAIMVALGAPVALLAVYFKDLAAVATLIIFVAVVFWLYPAWYRDFKLHQHNRSSYGQRRFEFTASTGPFVRIFAVSFLQIIGIMLISVIVGYAVGFDFPKPSEDGKPVPDIKVLTAILPMFVTFYIGLFLITLPYFRVRIDNLIWNNTHFNGNRFESRLEVSEMAALYVTNLLGVVFTLGFFMPWAMVRLARYRASCLSLSVSEPIDDIVAAPASEVGAVGEEAASVFDIDIAL